MILGLQGQFIRPERTLTSVYGFDVAVKDLFYNFIKDKSMEEIAVISDENVYQTAILKKWTSLAQKNQQDTLNGNINFYSEFDSIEKDEFKQVDILHNLSYEVISQYYYRNQLRRKNIPITSTIHCASYHNVVDTLLLPKILYGSKPYDSIICTSETLKKVFQKYVNMVKERLLDRFQTNLDYDIRLDVIPLGVDTSAFYPMEKSVCRDKYKIKRNSFVLLWMGRISAYDKADLFPLLRIIKNLKSKNDTSITFVIAGRDNDANPYLPGIMSLCKELNIVDSVKVLTNFDSKERNTIYNLADVFVSPIDSIQETFGLTPLEAMCAGIPQIVSDWDGYKDTVVENRTGLRIPTYRIACNGDITDSFMIPSDIEFRSRIQHYIMGQTTVVDNEYFERALQNFIDNPSLLIEMSKNSIRQSQKYDWKMIIEKYDELWRELSHIANREMSTPNTFWGIHSLNYDDLFSAYPTMVLSENIHLQITAQGKKHIEENGKIPLHYPFEKKLVHYQIQEELIKIFYNERYRQLALSDIYELMSKCYSKDVIVRAVMSLTKQGMLKVNEMDGAL